MSGMELVAAAAAVRNVDSGQFEALQQALFPHGVIDEAGARSLLHIPSGETRPPCPIETIVRILETARQAPALLAAHALRALGAAVIAGEGPAIGPRPHFTRVVDAGDVRFMHRVLTASGLNDQPISRAEAEALFELHDATVGADNDPEFAELFFRAIVHYLAAASGRTVGPRSAALASDAVIDHEALGQEPAAWLAQQIMRDGRPTPVELRLLALLGRRPEPSQSLRRLIDCAA